MTKILEIKKCDYCPFVNFIDGSCTKTGKDININTWIIPSWCPLPSKEDKKTDAVNDYHEELTGEKW